MAEGGRRFEHVAELARDDRARAALRAAGKLYRDNGRLEHAARTYRAIVERKPTDLDAWRALDDILSQLGRWRDVAWVRGELALHSPGGVDKAALLRGQARALEHAGESRAAAELVAEASHHAPDNISGLVDYADVLARGGQGREAAEIISARVDEAVDCGAPTDDVASLRLRLATILDESSAIAAAVAVLAICSPRRRITCPRSSDWRRTPRSPATRAPHSDALLRYAIALPDDQNRAPMIAQAARRASNAGNHTAAVRALEQVTREFPEDRGFAHQLDDVRVAQGVAAPRPTPNPAIAMARSIGSARCSARSPIASPPRSRSPISCSPRPRSPASRRTRVGSRRRRARRARAPRVSRRAAGRRSRRGAPALARGASARPARVADHARAGESCFQRKLWREAAIHLGALVDHPDVARHAIAVGAGLVHAALAETRALRPANAARHYEAAVRIDPKCAKAWHELAELALENGDTMLAAERLEREADATTEPADRLRLYDALGDLALDVLGDPARAEACWSKVARSGHAPVLHKLLAVQRKRGAGVERGATCALLAAIEPDESTRKAYSEEAIDAFAAGGDLARARDLAASSSRVIRSTSTRCRAAAGSR